MKPIESSDVSSERELEKPKILITGSKGKIGTVLVKGLAEKFKIVELDIAISSNSNSEIEFRADVSDLPQLRNAFQKIGAIDEIIHLAGNPNEGATWDEILKTNIVGTKNIYQCAQEFGVRRIIYASSTHIFGSYDQYPDKPSQKPILLDAQFRPDGYYAISKIFGESIARYYYDHFGIETISLRIGGLSKDNKPVQPYQLLWLSHRDAIQVFEEALTTKIPFGVYYAISVEPTIFDIDTTKKDLGFNPQDTKLPG